jgi:hypothetical protein
MLGRWMTTVVWVLLAQASLGAAVAAADGLPVLGVEGSNGGVRSADGGLSYHTHRAGKDTLLLRRTRDGRVVATRRLVGRLVVPVVAYDGSPSGLSADGRTLVLIRPRVRFPQAATALAILATHGLRVRSHLRLRGDFSFDAISPDGNWIYLIQYTAAADPTRYRVRALDVRTGRLVRGDIVDPHDREGMHGNPVTRLTSRDGRWAYTVYDGGGHPFVHALDTVARKARCIDLPAAFDPWSARLRLSAGDTQLLVAAHDRTVARIDTRTLVLQPAVAAAQPGHALGHPRRGFDWRLVIGILGVVALAMAVVRRSRPLRRLHAVDAP